MQKTNEPGRGLLDLGENSALAASCQFVERIEWKLDCAKSAPGGPFSLLMVGVDNLWLYADCLGTKAADRLVLMVARCIVEALSACTAGKSALQATVAHMGRDELAVLVEGGDAPDFGAGAARLIRQALFTLNPTPDLDAFATATIGVVDVQAGNGTHQSAHEILRDAQIALHHARTRGRGWTCVFQPDLRRTAASRLQLECDMRRAINQGEFHLVYQPIVKLESGQLSGFEALLRWRRSDGLVVSPADFVPLAEETGLVWPLGEFVLNEACRQLESWRKVRNVTMNVNISRRQFAEGGLTDLVSSVLTRHHIPASSLVLEITESSLLEDFSSVKSIMNRLTTAGVALHLDDFGTGYSSLGSLHQFPVRGIKMDRTFVANASGRRDYAAVLQAIVTLADNLNLDVVGEGVEQVALLQSLNCPYAQGYYFGKPMAAEAAETLLAADSLPRA